MWTRYIYQKGNVKLPIIYITRFNRHKKKFSLIAIDFSSIGHTLNEASKKILKKRYIEYYAQWPEKKEYNLFFRGRSSETDLLEYVIIRKDEKEYLKFIKKVVNDPKNLKGSVIEYLKRIITNVARGLREL